MKNLFQKLLWIGLFASVVVLLLDVVRPGYISNNFGLSTYMLVFAFLLFNLVLRFFNISLGGLFLKYSVLFFAPFLAIVSIVLRLVESAHFPNFVFSTISIDPVNFSVLYFFFLLIVLANFSLDVARKNYSLMLFILPLLFYPLYLLAYYSLETFEVMRHEDGLFEYLTMGGYLVASGISLLTLSKIRKLRLPKIHKTPLLLLFVFFAFAFFMIAGEEVSWGQRILNIQTPESIAVKNAQQETNFHNLNTVAPYIYLGYTIFGMYCMFAWAVRRLLSKIVHIPIRAWLHVITPNWYLMLFFLPMVVFSLVRHSVGNRWEELSELFLAVGLVLFVLELYLHLPEIFKKVTSAAGKKR